MINNLLFIAPNGKLYKETNVIFSKVCHEIIGISITELWGDTYQRNLKLESEVLFSATDPKCPFEVIEYKYSVKSFMNDGGGFRLDLNYEN